MRETLDYPDSISQAKPMTNPLVQAIDERIKELQTEQTKYRKILDDMYRGTGYTENGMEYASKESVKLLFTIYKLEQIKQLAIAEQERVVKELEARRQEATEKMDAYPDIDSIGHLIGLSELTDYTRAIMIVKGE